MQDCHGWLPGRSAIIGDPAPLAGRDTGTAAPQAGRDIAVSIEATTPADRAELFARAHAFSPRERELLGHLITGSDTREVAQQMFLSEHTVQAHLRSIFAKSGTRSRRQLLSRIVGS